VLVDVRADALLFIDDEETNRIVFQAVFGHEFQVIPGRGADVLELIDAHRPALVMIDQRTLAADAGLLDAGRERCPDAVWVLIVDYAELRAAVDAINRGKVARYFSRPWNSVELRSYLRTTLEIHGLNQRLRELQLEMLRSERLATLGLAASSIAHDLGSPVTSLLSCLDAVDLELQELRHELASDAELCARLGELQELLRACQTPTDEIVRVLKAVRRSIRSEHRREPVVLAAIVDAALRLLRGELVKRARVRVSCDPELTVLADAAELMQVTLNLLANAVAALPFGKQHEHRIEVRVEARDGHAELAVTDTGCGIAPELHAKIFKPLFTTRGDDGGTGLGLSIAKRIVDAHAGTIEVVSAPGEGSTFTVRLPLSPP
jgi:signal transduction histidine kinase